MDFRGVPPMKMTGNVAENWKFWKQRFQTYLLATEISEKEEITQCAQMLTLIGDEGIRIFNTFTMLPDEKDKINPLLEKFENHFIPRNNLTYQRHKFLTCKQQEGESIEQYVTELKNSANSCELGNLRDSLTRDIILICGLRSESLREKLLQEDNQPLEEAIRLCINMEKTKERNREITTNNRDNIHMDEISRNFRPENRDRRGTQSEQKTSNSIYPSKNSSSCSKNNERSCGKCGSSHGYGKCPAHGRKCSKCENTNHFARMCRSNKGSNYSKYNKNKATLKNINSVENDYEDDNNEIESYRDRKITENNDFLFIGTIEHGTVCGVQMESWVAAVNINGHKIEMKLDSGAIANVMPVYWVAPPENSGCVAIKASVVETRENWFSEDGQLTRILCEDNSNENIKPEILEKCCACDEAKYEVAFEGRWTRNTHPRNYPSDVWSTKFSDVIGISHQKDQSFWSEGALATEGLKKLAESGFTVTLESELKENSENIRTIIKARGLQYPNITESSYAVFRVDSKNHLVSLVSKIIPSPDWIVGVSNFELCKDDCTWAESYSFNLYPIDVGTDDGIEYSSSRPIRRWKEITPITPNNPNDPRSPFYSEDGEPINPIAKLHFTRQRVYEKPCEISENEDQNHADENFEITVSTVAPDDEKCKVGRWSEWSSCSVPCGTGTRTRDRELRNPENRDICRGVELQENEECEGEDKHCEYKDEPRCSDRKWGAWGPCNVTCGSGYKTRVILPEESQKDYDNDNDVEENCPAQETVKCTMPCDDAPIGENLVILEQSADGKVVNCEVSPWSVWSSCDLNGKSCGHGLMKRYRHIVRHPYNGGKSCPSRLYQKRTCWIPCRREAPNERNPDFDMKADDEESLCEMSEWTAWSPCSSICGSNAQQQRTRKIINKPSDISALDCPSRIDYKPCNLPIACTDDGKPILY